MKDWEELAILQGLRQEQKRREMATRYVRQQTYRRSRIAQDRIIRHLEHLGYQVHKTTHNAPFDAWIGGCRVEIKASHWQEAARRYQANVRHHQADVIIFDAVNGRDHYFVIPMAVVTPRKSIEVYSYNVAAYKGQWAEYLEAWEVLTRAVTGVKKPTQLLFWDIPGMEPPGSARNLSQKGGVV